MIFRNTLTLLLALCFSGVSAAEAPLPPPAWHPDHIVIVILENLSAREASPAQRQAGKAPVYDNPGWPFLNELARGGARLTESHFGQTPYGSGLPARPSQPNYLFLFSGHHQGVLPAWFEDEFSPYPGMASRDRNGQPLPTARRGWIGIGNEPVPVAWLPLQSPNLGAAVLQGGGSFASFSESLPYPSWNCATDSALVPCDATAAPTDEYRRKHNPAINWTDQRSPEGDRGSRGDLRHHVLPVTTNLGFEPTFDPVLKRAFRGFARDEAGRPLGFEHLPSVSLVIPNEQHDAHSNSGRAADEWLRRELGGYARWAMEHNSLLIVTFDEDGSTDSRRGDPYMTGRHGIPTIFFGAHIRPGEYAEQVDHLNVLATVLWLNGSLDRFRSDFRRFHRVGEGEEGEAGREYRNLVPIQGIFRK